jgi:hypothetical protein
MESSIDLGAATATFWAPIAAGWCLYGLIDRRYFERGTIEQSDH